MFIHANAERWSLDMNKYPAERGGRVYPRQLVQFSNEVMMALGTEILQQSAKGAASQVVAMRAHIRLAMFTIAQ